MIVLVFFNAQFFRFSNQITERIETSQVSWAGWHSPVILKNYADTLTTSIFKIFNLWFSLGKIPDCWKQADIMPLHTQKKGAKNTCKNSSSLINLNSVQSVGENCKTTFSRVFITDQYGFMKGRSSLSQLLAVFPDWAQNRNNGLACYRCCVFGFFEGI